MAILAGRVGRDLQQRQRPLEAVLRVLPLSVGVETEVVETDSAALLWRGVPQVGGLLESHSVGPGRSVVVAVDGYIANRKELAEGLGEIPPSVGAVLVAAYVAFGIEFVSRIVGSFALAIHDSEGNALHLVRDGIGSAPLYWGQRGSEVVAFASLPLAVCAGLGMPAELSVTGIQRELLGLDTLAPNSVFEGVAAVEPGTVLSWVGGNVHRRRYFDLSQLLLTGESDAHLVALLREGLAEGVGWYLGCPQSRVAVAFSGGLDSSAVLGAACSDPASRERILAVTAVASGSAAADRDFAALVTERCDVRWVSFQSEPMGIADTLLTHAANPVRVSDLALTWEVFERARREGCNTVLTGATGDLVGGVGWGWQLSMLWGGQTRLLLRELKHSGSRGLGLVTKLAKIASVLALCRLGVRRFNGGADDDRLALLLALLGVSGVKRRELRQECQDLANRLSVPGPDVGKWMVWLGEQAIPCELESAGLLGRVLGLQVSNPLSHPKVLAAGVSAPWSLRRRAGMSRIALREAAAPWIPSEVAQRREKLEFSEHLRPMWRSAITEMAAYGHTCHVAGFVDPKAFGELCVRQDSLPTDVVSILYEVTVLERWLRLNTAKATGQSF